MTHNELKDVPVVSQAGSEPRDLELLDPIDIELLDQGNEDAANEPFDPASLGIRTIPRQVSCDADTPDINELRLRIRKELLQGLLRMAAGLCLIIAGFVFLAP